MSCVHCKINKALIITSPHKYRLCKECFNIFVESQVEKTLQKFNLSHDIFNSKLILALSGGKDSSVMLVILHKIFKKINKNTTNIINTTNLNTTNTTNLDNLNTITNNLDNLNLNNINIENLNLELNNMDNLIILSIDEGIKGYREDSLKIVNHFKNTYKLNSSIISYKSLFDMTMDDVMVNKNNIHKRSCGYCGVFRRKSLDLGAKSLGGKYLLLGHNLDDVVETLVLNFVRGDLNRLGSSLNDSVNINFDNTNNTNTTNNNLDTNNTTNLDSNTNNNLDSNTNNNLDSNNINLITRLKPLMNISEKDIVMYAFHNKIPYFSTECTYAPTSFRGFVKIFIKKIERIDSKLLMNFLRNSIKIKEILNSKKNNKKLENKENLYNTDSNFLCKCGYVKGANKKICKACEFVDELNKL